MTQVGYIVAGYSVTFIVVAGYTFLLIRRLRAARRGTGGV